MTADELKRLKELFSAYLIETINQLLELTLAGIEVLDLRRKEAVPLFEVLLFLDCVKIDVAQSFDFASQLGDFLTHLFPVNGCVLIILVGLEQVKLQFVADPRDEVLLSNVKLANLYFNLIYLLFDSALLSALVAERLFIALLLGKQAFDLIVQLRTALLLLVFLAEQLGDSRFGSEDVGLCSQGLVGTTLYFGFGSRNRPGIGLKLGLERLDCLNQRLAVFGYLTK
jgi:hypothetical protein